MGARFQAMVRASGKRVPEKEPHIKGQVYLNRFKQFLRHVQQFNRLSDGKTTYPLYNPDVAIIEGKVYFDYEAFSQEMITNDVDDWECDRPSSYSFDYSEMKKLDSFHNTITMKNGLVLTFWDSDNSIIEDNCIHIRE